MTTRLSKLLPVAPIALGTTGVVGMTIMAMRDSSKSAVFFLVTVRAMILFSFIPSFRLNIPKALDKYQATIVWNPSQQHSRLRAVKSAPSTKRQDPLDNLPLHRKSHRCSCPYRHDSHVGPEETQANQTNANKSLV